MGLASTQAMIYSPVIINYMYISPFFFIFSLLRVVILDHLTYINPKSSHL